MPPGIQHYGRKRRKKRGVEGLRWIGRGGRMVGHRRKGTHTGQTIDRKRVANQVEHTRDRSALRSLQTCRHEAHESRANSETRHSAQDPSPGRADAREEKGRGSSRRHRSQGLPGSRNKRRSGGGSWAPQELSPGGSVVVDVSHRRSGCRRTG